jgi:cytohesin
MEHCYRRRRTVAAATLIGSIILSALIATRPRHAVAHETDQFTLPQGREFAELGDRLTRFAYDAVADGVERQNNKIRSAVERKAVREEIKELQSPDQLAASVNRQFPVAMFLIEDLDRTVTSEAIKPRYPGRVVGYKPVLGIRKNIDIAINPFRAWGCATIQAYGVYFGTDKVGHFTDMGMHYYRGYRSALAAGKSEDEALRAGIRIGTDGPIYSERGILGLVTAGAYSNADLVSNYMGMCFYRNLTDPVKLKGQQRPPMVERDGEYWKLAPHVRPGSDFFSWFFSEHLNEALNPSMYRREYRDKMRKAIEEHRRETLARYTDRNGNIRSREFFASKTKELFTYWGFDYGHDGDERQLITVAQTCFAPPPQNPGDPNSRNADGLTSIHWAAQSGDVEALKRLLDAGGDANARVPAGTAVPFVGDDTPLHLAAADGKIDAVKLLLARGADPSAKNERGVTPLHRAVSAAPAMIALLCESGAQVDAADQTGRTPLHFAANDPGAKDAVKTLLDHGARPMPHDRDGLTPMHLAAQSANADAVVALASAGAEVNAPDRFGVTPLHLAAAHAGAKVTDLLLQAGASADAKDKFGVTPLLVAARADEDQAVRVLLARGADPNTPDAYGVSALSAANGAGDDNLVRRLFQQSPPASVTPPAAGNGAVTARQTIPPGGGGGK